MSNGKPPLESIADLLREIDSLRQALRAGARKDAAMAYDAYMHYLQQVVPVEEWHERLRELLAEIPSIRGNEEEDPWYTVGPQPEVASGEQETEAEADDYVSIGSVDYLPDGSVTLWDVAGNPQAVAQLINKLQG